MNFAEVCTVHHFSHIIQSFCSHNKAGLLFIFSIIIIVIEFKCCNAYITFLIEYSDSKIIEEQ